jgi:hypothetical protein
MDCRRPRKPYRTTIRCNPRLVRVGIPAAWNGRRPCAFLPVTLLFDTATSFGASGDQSIAVSNGLPADIVAFSLEPDIGRLVGKGLVAKNWYKNKYHGFVTDSVVVFACEKAIRSTFTPGTI